MGDFTKEKDVAWLRTVCTQVGREPRMFGRPAVRNEGRMILGDRVRLSSRPVASHLVTAENGVLEIGDDVSISFGAAIYCEASVRVGAGTRIGPYVSLADSDFHVVGDRNARPPSKPVLIGRGVRIGARVTVLAGSTIGDGATIAAGSTVAGVVAAGADVAGVPALPRRTSAGGTAGEDLRALVARTLGLATLPALDDGPSRIPEWDSLGALRLLLAIEANLGIRLDERAMAEAKSVADLIVLTGLDGGPVAPTMDARDGEHAATESPVAALVQRVLGLSRVPGASAGPAQIPEWDSLGALRLLLAVEQEFNVRLDEREVAGIHSVAELAAAVERRRGSAQA